SEPIARKVFPGGDGGEGAPEFVDRFGPAYKAEVKAFIDCCRSSAEFPATHRDGLRAQQVIAAGMRAVSTRDGAAVVKEGALMKKPFQGELANSKHGAGGGSGGGGGRGGKTKGAARGVGKEVCRNA